VTTVESFDDDDDDDDDHLVISYSIFRMEESPRSSRRRYC
jgi:hypothetical protein